MMILVLWSKRVIQWPELSPYHTPPICETAAAVTPTLVPQLQRSEFKSMLALAHLCTAHTGEIVPDQRLFSPSFNIYLRHRPAHR